MKRMIYLIVFLLFTISISAYEIEYIHQDHLGNNVAITNEEGDVIWKADYEPFGSSFNEKGDNDYKYNSKEEDNTELLYYGARYYDKDIGRFTTPDPLSGSITDPQTLNRYIYVTNNPMNFIDPTGMTEQKVDKEKREIGLVLTSFDIAKGNWWFKRGVRKYKEFVKNEVSKLESDRRIPVINRIFRSEEHLEDLIERYSEKYDIKFLGIDAHGSPSRIYTSYLENTKFERSESIHAISLAYIIKFADISEETTISFFACSFGKCGGQTIADMTGNTVHATDKLTYGVNPKTGEFLVKRNIFNKIPLINKIPFLKYSKENTLYLKYREGYYDWYYEGKDTNDQKQELYESVTTPFGVTNPNML